MNKSEKQRIELSVHTNMSTLDGVSSAGEYIDAAAKEKMPAIAITDICSVRAFHEAYRYAKKYEEIKLIYGMEGYLAEDDDVQGNITKSIKILVQNKLGLRNLYKLISISNARKKSEYPNLTKQEIEEYREGLLIGSGCDKGAIYHAIRDKKSQDELLEIASFYDYLEIAPIENFRYYIESGYAKNEQELIAINRSIAELGDKLNKLVIATGEPRYVYDDDAECRAIIMHQKGCKSHTKLPNLRLRDTEEMLDEFSYLGEEKAYEVVVENTNHIAEMIDKTFAPHHEGMSYPFIKNANERIAKLAYQGAIKIYGNTLPDFVKEQLDWEIDKITKNGFSSAYLIVQEAIETSRRSGYIVGSRGSLAASLVAFLLGITEVNPLPPHYVCPHCHYTELHQEARCGIDMKDKACPVCNGKLFKDGFDIPIESFMGIYGDVPPDLELNVAPEIKEGVIERLKSLLGEDRVVKAGYSETVPYRDAYDAIQSYCREQNIKYSDERINIMREKITGIGMSQGEHPGKLLIIPRDKDVYDYTPLEYSHKGVALTHFDFHRIHDDLFCISLLKHDTPSLLHSLEKHTGLNLKNIRMDDKDTMEMIRTGKAFEVPEFGKPFIKRMIRSIDVGCFEDLFRIQAMSHGTGVWEHNAEYIIEDNIAGLADVICYREDAMRYLLTKGYDSKKAFQISERTRKGRGLQEEEIAEMRKNQVPEWYIDSCQMIKYAYPKAHCVDYVGQVYKIAYYKAHYPLEFYCAWFNMYIDFFEIGFLGKSIQELENLLNELQGNMDPDFIEERIDIDIIRLLIDMHKNGYRFATDEITTGELLEFEIKDKKLKPVIK